MNVARRICMDISMDKDMKDQIASCSVLLISATPGVLALMVLFGHW
jgi:hypothetical protein